MLDKQKILKKWHTPDMQIIKANELEQLVMVSACSGFFKVCVPDGSKSACSLFAVK